MERTATEKMWLVGGGLAAFVLLLIGYFFFISPQRGDTSNIEEQIATAQTTNLGLQGRIAALNAQNAKLSSYQQKLHVAQLALPATSGMPEFLRTLQSISGATSTSLTSLNVGTPILPAGAAVAAPSSTDSSSSDSTTTASAAPTAPAGIYEIPITATVAGSGQQLNNFLTQLQSVQPRAVIVTQLTLGAASPAASTTTKLQAGRTTLDIAMNAFVAPEAASVPAAGPTPAPSPSATS